ncbi:MAG: hypothetical protein AAFY72_16715 [Cyanobacteria bacterium J06649_4]
MTSQMSNTKRSRHNRWSGAMLLCFLLLSCGSPSPQSGGQASGQVSGQTSKQLDGASADTEPALLISEPVISEPVISESTANEQAGSKQADIQQPALQAVPPEGIDSLSENELSYFQQMGPLEYAARLGGVPEQGAWRVRLRLYPQDTGEPDGFTYQVKMEHFNLSPALYDELASSYGPENVDPSLNNSDPHETFQLTFFPIMGIAADFLAEETQIGQLPIGSPAPTCAFGTSCGALSVPSEYEPSANSLAVTLESAPWTSNGEDSEVLYDLVRSLAKQAGWLEGDGAQSQWRQPEMPEGISDERPWVEVQVDSYLGNGDGYGAQWIERVSDDSVQAVVHRVLAVRGSAIASEGVICNRGEDAGELRDICP